MFDANREIEKIVKWIRDWFEVNGPEANAVIGISGGKDSTIIAKLLTLALGKDRVFGVLMPNGVQADIGDSVRVVELLGIQYKIINIEKPFNAFIELLGGIDNVSYDTRVNIGPRLRMTTLYAVAQGLPNGGRVCNTCNASEDYVGYSTKFGDSAGDFSPCMEYMVSEMLQIGDALGLPYDLIHKAPSDGLCGKTDEDNLGFTYAVLDQYITTGNCEDEAVQKIIERKHRLNLHKLELMDRYNRDDRPQMLNFLPKKALA